MNLDQIASRIAKPDSCQGSEIPALKALTEKYPFSQVFSILYLKALSGQNDIGFDEALQKHAYRVTDRMKLYDLIHSIPQPEPVKNDAVTIHADRDAVHRIEDELENEPVAETENEIIADETAPVEKDIVTIQPDSDAMHHVHTEVDSTTEIAPITEEIKLPVTEPEIDFVLEPAPKEENQESDKNEEIEQIKPDAEEPSLAPDFIQDEVELEIISQVVATVYNDNLEHSIPEKPVEEKKSEPLITPGPAVENNLLEGKRSFSSWLKAGNQTASTPVAQPEKTISQEEKPAEKQIDKIIDNFIEKEPTISRPKKEFYSPTKKAKESVSSAGLIYTETLADIFAIQGNFPKAITAYEQLMLTNPEKKIFFAQRIKELKEKLNT